MVQIISDKQSDWVEWLGNVIDRLEDYPNITRMVVFAKTEEDEENSHAQIIEFMNCDTDDIFHIGGVLQKEAIKHEMAEEFGLDDNWEADWDGSDDYNYEDV